MQLYRVTKILSTYADYSKIPVSILEHAQERGTIVHKVCGNYALGIYSPAPEEYKGYIKSFTDWFNEYVDEVLFVEKEFQEKALGFFGHPDIGLIIRGDKKPSLCDLKTPISHSRLWRLQLAAYKHLLLKKYPTLSRVFSLRLDPAGGKPKFKDYTDTYLEDLNIFLSAINVHRFIEGGN